MVTNFNVEEDVFVPEAPRGGSAEVRAAIAVFRRRGFGHSFSDVCDAEHSSFLERPVLHLCVIRHGRNYSREQFR